MNYPLSGSAPNLTATVAPVSPGVQRMVIVPRVIPGVGLGVEMSVEAKAEAQAEALIELNDAGEMIHAYCIDRELNAPQREETFSIEEEHDTAYNEMFLKIHEECDTTYLPEETQNQENDEQDASAPVECTQTWLQRKIWDM